MLKPSPASPASCQRLPARRNVAGDGVHVRGERARLCGGRGLRPHRGRAGALCAALLAAAAGMHGTEAAQTWRGLAVAPSTAARRTSAAITPTHSRSRRVSSPTWVGVQPVYGAAFRQPPRDGHLAYSCDIRGPRQRPVRCGRGHEVAVRLQPPEPDAGGARGEPAPEEREGRRGVAAADEPLLVRGPGGGGQAQVPAGRGRARGACPGGGPVAVRVDRDGGGRRAGGGTGFVVEGACGGRGRRAALGLERERAHHLPRGARTASPQCGAVIRPTRSCATATGTAWCASEGADGDALQVTGSGGVDSWLAGAIGH